MRITNFEIGIMNLKMEIDIDQLIWLLNQNINLCLLGKEYWALEKVFTFSSNLFLKHF